MQTRMPQKPTARERDALIEALKRFDYVHIPSRPFQWNVQTGYYETEVWDTIYRGKQKPYHCYFAVDHLVIIHESCTQCHEIGRRTHSLQFLQEMIPIIGRLDAQAIFDPGPNGIDGPWLRIFL